MNQKSTTEKFYIILLAIIVIVTVIGNMVPEFKISYNKKQADLICEQYENIENILKSFKNKDIIDIVKMSEEIYKAKEEIYSVLEYMNVLLLKLSKEDLRYINAIDIVEETKKRLKANSNYDMCIDNLLFNISYLFRK